MFFTTIFFTLVSVIAAVPDWTDICARHGSGTWCRNDLTGYVKCGGGWWGDYKLLGAEQCAESKRCACLLGNDCDSPDPFDLVGHKQGGLCQKLKKASPMKDLLHLTYKKRGWEEIDIDEEVRHDVDGHIMQDVRQQSRMHTWTDNKTKKRSFELIIPDDEGAFIKYSGHYPNVCTRRNVKNFEEFGGEIRYFRNDKTQTKALRNNYESQVWYNFVLDGMFERGQERIWTVMEDLKEERIIPLKYQYIDSDEGCCALNIVTEYEEVPVTEDTNTNAWFDVPDVCQH